MLPAPGRTPHRQAVACVAPSDPSASGSSRGTALAPTCSSAEPGANLCSQLSVREEPNTEIILTPSPLGRLSKRAAKPSRNALGLLFPFRKAAFNTRTGSLPCTLPTCTVKERDSSIRQHHLTVKPLGLLQESMRRKTRGGEKRSNSRRMLLCSRKNGEDSSFSSPASTMPQWLHVRQRRHSEPVTRC